MRLKHVKGAEEKMLTSEHIIQEPKTYKGKWKEDMPSAEKLCVEIGMGKGRFLIDMASLHPETLYVGIEKFSSVMIRAVEKQEELELENIRLIRFDAEGIEEIFDNSEVDIIYLNFSDPWPKDRHAKRRLTSPQFLERYKKILSADGHIEFKTDNMDLFEYSVESIKESGWIITEITRDLHNDEKMNEGNVMTEYEERFSSKGNPIAKVIAMPYNKA